MSIALVGGALLFDGNKVTAGLRVLKFHVIGDHAIIHFNMRLELRFVDWDGVGLVCDAIDHLNFFLGT
jgi:hypothetical protein